MLDKALLTHMLRQMYRIRFFEERVKRFYNYRGFFEQSTPEPEAKRTDEPLSSVLYDFAKEGMIGGAIHLSIGQEAVAVGVCSALEQDDYIVSSHRGHGHAIAKGVDIKCALAELMGRETGLCHGCGGSMHLFDLGHGLLGGNGIIGGQLPISLGPAFAAKYRGTRQVSVAFFGDGGANQGTFNESLNLASLWKLPVIFVCENNLYAASTPTAIAFPTEDIAPRARPYDMPGLIVDGQDVVAVYEVTSQAVRRARAGEGPTFLEAKTYRYEGHGGLSKRLHDPEEYERWRKRDPIMLLERKLVAEGLIDREQEQRIRDEALTDIDEAEQFAKTSPLPDPQSLAQFST